MKDCYGKLYSPNRAKCVNCMSGKLTCMIETAGRMSGRI